MILNSMVKVEVFARRTTRKIITRDFKGVNFLEYALLALLVVGIFAGIGVFFRDQIKELLESINTSINNNSNTTVNAPSPTR